MKIILRTTDAALRELFENKIIYATTPIHIGGEKLIECSISETFLYDLLDIEFEERRISAEIVRSK